MKYIHASNAMDKNGIGVLHFTVEGMLLLEDMLEEFAKKKKDREVKQQ